MENMEESYYKARRRRKKERTKPNVFLLHSFSSFVKAFLAGVMVSVGAIVFLSVNNKYLGSALFSMGLFTIFSYGLALFTGRVGYMVVQPFGKNIQLIPVWLGNLAGTLTCGYIVQLTRVYKKIAKRALTLCEEKLDDGLISIFILSVFCGILMFIAADNFKNATNSVQKYLAIVLPVMVFILCGFEHCIANMFYFTVANSWNFKAVLYIFVMTAGNSFGGIIIPATHKFIGLIRKRLVA